MKKQNYSKYIFEHKYSQIGGNDESIDNLIENLSNDDKNSILKIKNYWYNF